LSGYSAASEIMSWQADAENEDDLAYLPIMKTDITLRSNDQTIVADAKYYKEALTGGRYSAKIQSAHLYQISTYIEHARRNEPDKPIAGLLIYPSNGQSLRLRYRLMGSRVTVATINLAAEWPDIHTELLEVIQEAEAKHVERMT
jgi:5-methylcytosine-specific restriction enzyme subunit McrC